MKKIAITHKEGGGAILTIDGEVVQHVLSIDLRWDDDSRRFEFVYTAHISKSGQFPTVQEVTFHIPDFTLDVR